MSDEDLFYKDVEGRMEELKQKPIKKEKETRGEKISKTFSLHLGFNDSDWFALYFAGDFEVDL